MKTETDVSNLCRLAVQRYGATLWRNNVGALKDIRGIPVRFGLANDSKQFNEVFKSSDLIGLTADGRFFAVETKEPDWRWSGTDRERAQLRFILYVRQHRGCAGFATCPEHAIEICRGLGQGAPHGSL